MTVKLEKPCIWCGAMMTTTRQDKQVCSTKCQNKMAYVHRSEWGWLTKEEFYQVLNNWIENSTHLNPEHPLAKADAAMAEFYQSVNNLLETTIELHKQQQGGILNA